MSRRRSSSVKLQFNYLRIRHSGARARGHAPRGRHGPGSRRRRRGTGGGEMENDGRKKNGRIEEWKNGRLKEWNDFRIHIQSRAPISELDPVDSINISALKFPSNLILSHRITSELLSCRRGRGLTASRVHEYIIRRITRQYRREAVSLNNPGAAIVTLRHCVLGNCRRNVVL
ncbi:hypothetical protein EVAR_61124_1 [Eumeta japonica]|uniref:Uncharacterized protein n=1 Tax=Eumeta variegata TaxID=151549 RepID=A0A4C1ZIQ0_EUMVA|nr:hypothetical protein EVAR_61124_1 [Eumeta japonica]